MKVYIVTYTDWDYLGATDESDNSIESLVWKISGVFDSLEKAEAHIRQHSKAYSCSIEEEQVL